MVEEECEEDLATIQMDRFLSCEFHRLGGEGQKLIVVGEKDGEKCMFENAGSSGAGLVNRLRYQARLNAYVTIGEPIRLLIGSVSRPTGEMFGKPIQRVALR
jgi:hypothetical protein